MTNKRVEIDREEIKRAITVMFKALHDQQITEPVAAAACQFMLQTFREKGIHAVIMGVRGGGK